LENNENLKKKNSKIKENYKTLEEKSKIQENQISKLKIIQKENKYNYEQSNNENFQKLKVEMDNLNTNLKTENDKLLADNNGIIVEEYTKLKIENKRLKNKYKLIDKKTEHDEILEYNKTLNVDLEKERNKNFY